MTLSSHSKVICDYHIVTHTLYSHWRSSPLVVTVPTSSCWRVLWRDHRGCCWPAAGCARRQDRRVVRRDEMKKSSLISDVQNDDGTLSRRIGPAPHHHIHSCSSQTRRLCSIHHSLIVTVSCTSRRVTLYNQHHSAFTQPCSLLVQYDINEN